jgi:thiol-disulfide isomerase/thioredoxin
MRWSSVVLAAVGPVLFGGNVAEAFLSDNEDASAIEAGLTSVNFDVDWKYIFAEPHNIDAAAPVMDHIVPDTISDFNEDKPSFLYYGHQPSRIVLFYGDYCDTIQEFKPIFIQWAKGLQVHAEANNEFVMIYAVSCQPNRELCLDQAVNGFPVVKVLKKNEMVGKDLSYNNLTYSNVFRELGFDFVVEQDQKAWTAAGSAVTSPPPSQLRAQFSMDYVRRQGQSVSVIQRRQSLMNDIHLSLDLMLRTALFTEKKPLSRDRKRRFLKVQ